jgi:predicted TIM-barrel fold metal-dependent hydrolase
MAMMNRSLSHNRPAIDAHLHITPDKATMMLEIMDTNKLTHIVNVGTLEVCGWSFEDGMRIFRNVLGNRLAYFPTPDFSDTAPGFGERMADELERKVQAGACGLKIFKELGLRHKDAEGRTIPIDDPRLNPLWARAGELGVPVLIHTADPLAHFQPLNEDNERLEQLLRHPDWHYPSPEFTDHDTLLDQRNHVIELHPITTFIGAHLGNYAENLSYVDACLDRYSNLYVDTSARISTFGRHPTEQVREFFLKHQDRVLFGSDLILGWDTFADEEGDVAQYTRFYDAHWRFFETDEEQIDYPESPLQGERKVNAISLPNEVLDKLYVQNAQRLIPRLRA